MVTFAFDTLNYARRLMAVGVSEEQATIQAEVLADAFLTNSDSLVTKEYLDARLSELDNRNQKRFAEIDQRFARIDVKLAEIDGKFTLMFWMLGIIIASTTLPQLVALFSR